MAKQSKLPKVRYTLKNYIDKDGDKQVLAAFRYQGKKLVYQTGEKIKPKYWGKGQAKESVNYAHGAVVNKELGEITKTIQNIYREADDKDIELQAFRNEIDYRRGIKKRPNHKKKQLTFYQWIDKEINTRKADVIGKTGQTWQKFQASLNHLKKYANDVHGSDISYNDINEEFVKDYIKWLFNVKAHSQNTVAKEIRNLKQFLRHSQKYHNNTYHMDVSFKVDRKYIPKNYPTLEELKQLFMHKFEDETIEKAADLYLVSAFAGGLRISDVLRLSPQNEIELEGSKVLQVFTYKGRNTKNDNEVIIPITPQMRSLIDKYDWKFPQLSEQQINRSIKEAFELAEINRMVLKKSAKKDNEIKSVPLHKVVSFHTARYANINYMLNDLGVSIVEMQKISGQSVKVLMGYVNGNKGRNAVKVGERINAKLAGLKVVKNEAV